MRSASSPSQQGLALAQKVRAEIQSRHLIERDDAVLVAVSGGVDSVALLDILTRWAPEEHWRLSVAHFNHRLRGDEADADEAWVKRLAAQYGLPCLAGRGSVRAQAQKHGVSCEMAGRALRHVFLARAAATSGALRIALGHQADDQAETVLLRLLRGSGGEGLGAMR